MYLYGDIFLENLQKSVTYTFWNDVIKLLLCIYKINGFISVTSKLSFTLCLNLTSKVRGLQGPSAKISRGPDKNLGARKIAQKLI